MSERFTPTESQLYNIYITYRLQEHEGNELNEYDFMDELGRYLEQRDADVRRKLYSEIMHSIKEVYDKGDSRYAKGGYIE